MNVIIRKIGNSEGIIIPKEILQKRGLAAGDNLVIMEDGDDLRIKRVQDDREEFERKMKIALKTCDPDALRQPFPLLPGPTEHNWSMCTVTGCRASTQVC